MERYLRIERARLGRRLVVEQTVDSGIDQTHVPGLILQPLVENAVQHAVATRPEGGQVRIQVRSEDVGLRIVVEDDGPGLPEEVRERLAAFGAVAALAGIERAVDAGTSGAGGGAGQRPKASCPELSWRRSPELRRAGGGRRPHRDRGAPMSMLAVVVDDEPLARRRLRRLLGAHEDVEVVGEATNGDEAVAVVLESRPDVLFMDVRMPGSDGLQALRMLREKLPADVLPMVVFTTAYEEHAVEAFELEGTDYLVKPVDKAALARSMQRLRRGLWGRGRLAALPAEAAATAPADEKGGGGDVAAPGEGESPRPPGSSPRRQDHPIVARGRRLHRG